MQPMQSQQNFTNFRDIVRRYCLLWASASSEVLSSSYIWHNSALKYCAQFYIFNNCFSKYLRVIILPENILPLYSKILLKINTILIIIIISRGFLKRPRFWRILTRLVKISVSFSDKWQLLYKICLRWRFLEYEQFPYGQF